MKALSKILIGGAGVAALVGAASPAAAQYYPNPYPYGGYGNSGGGVIGAIINAIGGYGQYPYGNYGYNRVNDRYAIDQCSRAVEARIGGNAYGYGYGGYGYNNAYAGGRVAGITRVEPRSNGGLKVYGVAMTGQRYGAYGYNRGTSPDLKFNCKIDRNGRIYDVDIDRLPRYSRNDYYYGWRY